MRPTLLLLLGLALSAPASAQKNSKRCATDPADSSLTRRTPVYRDCDVDKPAKVITPMHHDFQPPQDGSRASRCYSAELEFVVDTLGWAESATAHKVAGNSEQLGEAMVSAIATVRYEPGVLGGHPVRQLVRYKLSAAVRTVVTRGGVPPTSGPPDRPPGC